MQIIIPNCSICRAVSRPVGENYDRFRHAFLPHLPTVPFVAAAVPPTCRQYRVKIPLPRVGNLTSFFTLETAPEGGAPDSCGVLPLVCQSHDGYLCCTAT